MFYPRQHARHTLTRYFILGLAATLSLAGCGGDEGAVAPTATAQFAGISSAPAPAPAPAPPLPATAPASATPPPTAVNSITVTNVTELVAAVDAGAPGAQISLAAGTYKLPAALRLKSGMALLGAGQGRTIITNAANFTFGTSSDYGDDVNLSRSFRERYLVDLERDQKNMALRSMTLRGPGVYGAVHFIAATGVSITDIEFQDFLWSGIRGYIGKSLVIANNRFTGAGGSTVRANGSFGNTGGSMFLTYLSNSIIKDNQIDKMSGRPDNVFGIKGREFRSVRIVYNTIRTFFAIELPFENDDYVDIENNFLGGAVSIPKYAGGDRVPPGPNPYTFRIRNNYFTTSYALEGPRNWLIVENNVFDIPSGDDGGNIMSTFDPSSQTPSTPGPVLFKNNLIVNPGRGVFWSDAIYNGVTFENNYVLANERVMSRYPEGLFAFRNSSPAFGGISANFATIRLTSNIIEILGTSRLFIRNRDSYRAQITNNRLINVSDRDVVINPQTGAPQGLLTSLTFNVGVNGMMTVNSDDVLQRARTTN